MIKFTEIAGIIAGVLSILDFFLYSISIVRHKTTPNRATWLIFSLVGLLIFSSYYSLGARETIWVALGYAIGPFVIFLLSIKFGTGGWSSFDKLCLLGASTSLVLWWLFNSALIALLINILIDFFGILPTIKKSYLDPTSEEGLPWFITFISCVLNIFAIQVWKFEIWIYPVYMLITNGAIVFILYFFKYKNISAKSP